MGAPVSLSSGRIEYIERAPTIEFKDGMFFYTDATGARSCSSPHTLNVFIEAGRRALRDFHDNITNPVPFQDCAASLPNGEG